MFNLNLQSIKTTEAFIINKREINGEQIELTFTRKIERNDEDNTCIGTCIADMHLDAESDITLLDRSFCAKVRIEGTFSPHENMNSISDSDLRDFVLLELFPHIRATLASLMSGSGMPPYLIPTSLIAHTE